MTDGGERHGPTQRRRVVLTAFALGAVALGFYIGFIVVTAAST